MMQERVSKQVRLPLSRALEIAWRGVRVRMGRSVLTLVTIAMAIAFLTNVWTTRVVDAAIASGIPADGAAVGDPGGGGGGPARTIWLLSLSLLVCLVGISNAMLMSVMERFREIGTMKCLGALDSFILKLFFLESLMLGAAGSLLGALLGEMLTIILLSHRVAAARAAAGSVLIPWGLLWIIAAASIGIGLFITAAAALYPAWKAARMEPIAAMRVEV